MTIILMDCWLRPSSIFGPFMWVAKVDCNQPSIASCTYLVFYVIVEKTFSLKGKQYNVLNICAISWKHDLSTLYLTSHSNFGTKMCINWPPEYNEWETQNYVYITKIKDQMSHSVNYISVQPPLSNVFFISYTNSQTNLFMTLQWTFLISVVFGKGHLIFYKQLKLNKSILLTKKGGL